MPWPKPSRYEFFVSSLKSHSSDDCLIWPYAKVRRGYGILNFNGKDVKAHRLAFFVTHGRWPEPCALHKCDVPECFNPRHIFEGTFAENLADCANKGRTLSGALNPAARITAEIVKQIRAEYRRGTNGSWPLSKKFGVSRSQIKRIIRRETWKNV